VWALINGEPAVGVSVHRIVDKFDGGEIFHIERIDLNDEMTHEEIYRNVTAAIDPILDRIADGTITGLQERDVGRDVYWRVRTIADSRINWHLSGKKIFYFVRALARPPIHAFSDYLGVRFKFAAIEIVPAGRFEIPGTVVTVAGRKGVICGDGTLAIILALFSSDEPEDGIVLQ